MERARLQGCFRGNFRYWLRCRIVVDRKIYDGVNKIAGEFGHHTVSFEDGRLCWCGRRGCVETYVSGSGIEAQYLKKLVTEILQRIS